MNIGQQIERSLFPGVYVELATDGMYVVVNARKNGRLALKTLNIAKVRHDDSKDYVQEAIETCVAEVLLGECDNGSCTIRA